MNNNSLIKRVLSCFPVYALTVFLLSCIEPYYKMRFSFAVIIFFSLISVGLICFLIEKRNKIWSVIVLIVLVLLSVAGIVCFAGICNFHFVSLSEFSHIFSTTDFVSFLIVCVSAFALFSLLAFALNISFVTKIISLAIVTGILILLSVNDISCSKLCAISGISYIVFTLSYLYFHIAYKGKQRDERKNAMSFLVAPAVLIAVVVSLIPATDKPLEWRISTKVINNVCRFASDVSFSVSKMFSGNPDEYSLSMTGYSDDGTIGGNIRDSNSISLYAYSRNLPDNNLYLIGSVKDTYNKGKWNYSNNYKARSYDEYTLDYLEYVYAVYRSNLCEDKHILNTREVELTYNKILTSSVFYPLKTFSFTDSDQDRRMSFEKPCVSFYKKPEGKVSYTVRFVDIDYAQENFKKLVDEQQNYSYDSNKVIDSDSMKQKINEQFHQIDYDIPSDLENILKKRSEEIYRCYADSADVSPRIKSLAADITKDCKDDYSKLKAIERYLNRYEYTKSPGNVPKGKDPIEYFLFDSRRGYCTYFASSMVLLAKSCGIPARYVEGFSTQLGLTDKVNNFEVNSNEAHAWTEAYIKGIGWIGFEPTSSFVNKRYKDRTNIYFYYNDSNKPEKIPASVRIKKAVTNIIIIPLIVLLSVALLALIVFVIYIISRNRKRRKLFDKMNNNDKYKALFSYYMWCAKLIKLPLADGETLNEYVDRCAEKLPAGRKVVDRIVSTYMGIRYGSSVISDNQLKIMNNACADIEKVLIEKKGKFRFRLKKLLADI